MLRPSLGLRRSTAEQYKRYPVHKMRTSPSSHPQIAPLPNSIPPDFSGVVASCRSRRSRNPGQSAQRESGSGVGVGRESALVRGGSGEHGVHREVQRTHAGKWGFVGTLSVGIFASETAVYVPCITVFQADPVLIWSRAFLCPCYLVGESR